MSHGEPAGGLRFDTVTFLSDYGTADEFVGVVHSVIRQLAPGVAVVDLTHEIEPYDVRAASLTLARSTQYLCPGVVLAVVDPGVGTARRGVAVEVAGGKAVMIGPDNGLLAAAVAMAGGAERAVVLDRPEYHLAAPGPTFDGRDVFAPVAAHLCRGVALEEVGTPIDPASLLPGLMPLSEVDDDGVLRAEVLWIDRYGNVQLNVDPDQIQGWPGRVELQIGERRGGARRVVAFAELRAGEIGLMVDSYGLLTLVADRASASEQLGLGAGDAVGLAALDGAEGLDGATPVSLTLRLEPGGEAGP